MPSLVSLAEGILAQAKKLELVLEENNIPFPSFENDTLDSLPEGAQQLRKDLLDSSHDFRQLVRGAGLSGLDICYSWTNELILRIIWRYKLASAVPSHGSATFEQISAATGLSEPLVLRTVRAALSLNIFDEPKRGQVTHTAISRLLAENEGFYNAVGLQLEDLGPASLKLIDAWELFGADAGEPDQSAFSLANGGRSLFTVLAEEPERAHRFDSAMKYVMEDDHFDFSDIVRAHDWSSLDKAGSRVVDLGGGWGQVSQVLAKHTQHVAFTIQELPHVANQGRALLPAEPKGRISFEGRSFLDAQPAENPPAAFLISRCLHNWSDRHCVTILRALVPALRTGSKILIWDVVLDDSPVKKVSERFTLQQDFIMATVSNGKDRSAADFTQVLAASDHRFRVENIQRPEGCKLSLIEVVWEGHRSKDAGQTG